MNDASDSKEENPQEDVNQKILTRSFFEENGDRWQEYGEDYIKDTHSEQRDRPRVGMGQGDLTICCGVYYDCDDWLRASLLVSFQYRHWLAVLDPDACPGQMV